MFWFRNKKIIFEFTLLSRGLIVSPQTANFPLDSSTHESMVGNYARFYVVCRLCFKINLFPKSFKNTIRVSNSFGPDLNQNCFHRLPAKNM